MGNNTSRKYSYMEYYDIVSKNKKNFNFDTIDLDKLNPYEVLNVSKNFTWEELKNNYKEIAFKTHPDKQGGNERIFKHITETFKLLANEYKNRQRDKTSLELKKEATDYYKNIPSNEKNPFDIDNKVNFNEKFNKTFNLCKLENDDVDFGYGDIMEKSSKNRDDINIDKLYNKSNFDNKSFNDIFNKHTTVTKQLIKYQEPQALDMAKKINYTEIATTKTDDYSSSLETAGKNSLVYTDYMKAYTNTREIDPEIILKLRKDFNNVEDYEKYRDKKIKKGLTDKERKMIDIKKQKEEKDEYDRQERIKQLDIKIQENHTKANRLLIR